MAYGNNQPGDHSYYDNINTEWYSYHLNQATNNSKVNKFRDLDSEANAKTFEDIFEYISEIFQVPKPSLQHQGVNIMVAPVFFKLKDPEFSDNKFKIEGQGVMTNVSGVIRISETDNNGRPLKVRRKINFDTSDLKLSGSYGSFVKFVMEKEIEGIMPDDHFKIVATRNNVIIADESRPIKPYWPKSNVTNPLMPTFERFVPFEQLKDMLLEPKPRKLKSKNLAPEDVFERAIGWLLNLLGIPAIQLQENDQSGEGHERISADVIASYQKSHIILAHMTIGTVKPPDIDAASNANEQIAKILDNVKIISVHFTPKSVQQLKSTITQKDQVLIGKEELEQIISNLKNGDVEDARKMIMPDPSELPGL